MKWTSRGRPHFIPLTWDGSFTGKNLHLLNTITDSGNKLKPIERENVHYLIPSCWYFNLCLTRRSLSLCLYGRSERASPGREKYAFTAVYTCFVQHTNNTIYTDVLLFCISSQCTAIREHFTLHENTYHLFFFSGRKI